MIPSAYRHPPRAGRKGETLNHAVPAAALSFAATKQNSTEHVAAGPRAPLPFHCGRQVGSPRTSASAGALAGILQAPCRLVLRVPRVPGRRRVRLRRTHRNETRSFPLHLGGGLAAPREWGCFVTRTRLATATKSNRRATAPGQLLIVRREDSGAARRPPRQPTVRSILRAVADAVREVGDVLAVNAPTLGFRVLGSESTGAAHPSRRSRASRSSRASAARRPR
jgi:hypothetical protein